MLTRRVASLLAAIGMMAVVACSGPGEPTGSTQQDPSPSSAGASIAEIGGEKPLDANGGQDGNVTVAGELGKSQPAPVTPLKPTVSPVDLPDASATLDPPCVVAGEKMLLTVDTGERYSGVVYLAYYEGGKNGAPPPYGDGYGGNAAGPTDEKGRYLDAWVVRPDAPKGPARVDITILYRSQQRQGLTIPFRVVGVGDVAGADGC